MSFKKVVPNKTSSQQQTKKAKWKKIGAILKSKKDSSFYIKIDQDVNLSKGDYVTVKNPREVVTQLVERGVLTESQAEERLSKIPDWVKYELLVAEKGG